MRFLPAATFAAVLAGLASPLAAAPVELVPDKPELTQLVSADSQLEKLADGYVFLEGPAFDAHKNILYFCDTRTSKLHRYDPVANKAEVFRDPSGHTNGDAMSLAGELISCEQGAGRLTITRADGKVDVLADRHEGKLLNAPNDVIVKSDGTIWFTDPTYGMEHPKEQPANYVFRLDPKTGEVRAVASDFDMPNGLCFSPDEKHLYIADSGRPRHVRIFDVTLDGHIENGRVFCRIDRGVPDGIRCDPDGNLWSSAGDGIHIFTPAGERLGKILVPETPANLCFGGADGRDLYICARTSLYRIKLPLAAKK